MLKGIVSKFALGRGGDLAHAEKVKHPRTAEEAARLTVERNARGCKYTQSAIAEFWSGGDWMLLLQADGETKTWSRGSGPRKDADGFGPPENVESIAASWQRGKILMGLQGEITALDPRAWQVSFARGSLVFFYDGDVVRAYAPECRGSGWCVGSRQEDAVADAAIKLANTMVAWLGNMEDAEQVVRSLAMHAFRAWQKKRMHPDYCETNDDQSLRGHGAYAGPGARAVVGG